MIQRPFHFRRWLAHWLLIFSSAVGLSGSDLNFTTPATLSTEAQALVTLLENAHYNRGAVHSDEFREVIPDYMAALDTQHLFFLESDKVNFSSRFGNNVYYNVDYLGKIDSAYEIFYTYDDRVTSRIGWIFGELKKDLDFTANDTYRLDRSKLDYWPANKADADDLWRKRIKFEVLSELLNKKTLDQAREVVRKRYERMLKNVGETEGSELAELFLTTIAGLYDPHSNYFSADTYEDFGIQMKLELVGIGAMLGTEDDMCVVREIVPGGPADLNRQLKPNDKIIAVAQSDGEPVEIIGLKLRKIVDMIRGSKGTRVRLIVQPASATDTSVRKEIVITRDVVKLDSARARAAVFQVPGAEGGTVPLGVITLPAFYGNNDEGDTDRNKSSASEDVAKLIVQLKQAGIQGLVLDLRHNGGGFLSEAIELAGLFIHKGPVVQVKDYEGDIQVDSDKAESLSYDGPMAVLVDRFSASASEIVAGALQDYGRAVVIGDNSTHGKGSVQTVVEMKRFAPQLANSPAKTGAAKITIQKFYLPDGSSTQLRGVVSDIVLPSVDEYLPIGESDLPHALVWDKIKTSSFHGAPIDRRVLARLQLQSSERQAKLQEFAFVRKYVDWFKDRQAQKLISLNLEERRKQKDADDAFRKESKLDREQLAKADYPYKEFRLGPPLPPRIVAPKAADAAKAGPPKDDEGSDFEDADEDANADEYGKLDVSLREALRVVDDAIALGRDHEYWASDHAPLTVAAKG
ncbi:MAG TPA: carboxy terminal-processing peptidase [Opitutaceae bacterium]|nr:carboxy terminal-processing peptidase [Opitutaceae bacterium]